MIRDDFWAETRDGWALHLQRTRSPRGIDRARRPLLIVPGYGMNGFIFGFHPRGTSLEAHLADEGIEVWTVNLRGQGRSRREHPDAHGPTMQRYAEEDVSAAIDRVLAETETKAERLDVLGASLGGSITFAHLARRPGHRVASVIAIGSPLRWEEVPLFLRIPFASRRIAGLVKVQGARKLAERVLPLVKHAPMALSVYMNAAHVDLGAASELVRTVEDPDPRVNRDIAGWMRAGDLVIDGVNVTEAMHRERAPLLLVVANKDGIVPERVATSAGRAWGGSDVTTLRIGTEDDWYAHADLFVGHESPKVVFAPIERWLRERA
jgi:pimeloyl-ACP methyl ester carboxylesterase